ncbi:uncharacterized protein LOC129593320 [Paramacrobiotus metropolitanus]|uniref:uncharacterized protein LOC129593320 n=1 Tax=Paramacrobiotus metropolitanus TaxID=2943436 RepID=UPI002445FA1D|nr:uncharacterized protein LOC129593320 [Paramacrobiotus metropolitanus]
MLVCNVYVSLMGILAVAVQSQGKPAPAKPTTTTSPVPKALRAKMAQCIVECAQCQDLIGSRFDHRLCSKECLERKGLNAPDCTNPAAIRRYLIATAPGVHDTLTAGDSGSSNAGQRRLIIGSGSSASSANIRLINSKSG